MNKETEFQNALSKAMLDNKIDPTKLQSDEKMMLLCMDIYYMGCLNGIERLSNKLKEKTS